MIKGLILGVVLAFNVNAGVEMTVHFHDGKEVVRQFEDFSEFLMTMQAREQCAAGVKKVVIVEKYIEGLDEDPLDD